MQNTNRRWIRWTGELALVAAALALLLASVPARAEDENHDGTRIALAWVDAWNSHDADRVVALFTPDAVYEDVPLGVANHGIAEIRAFAQGFFDAVPDSRIIYVSSFRAGKRGAIEWVFEGTDVGIHKTGKRFSVRGMTALELHGQLITRNVDYYDLATMLRQFGLLPPGL